MRTNKLAILTLSLLAALLFCIPLAAFSASGIVGGRVYKISNPVRSNYLLYENLSSHGLQIRAVNPLLRIDELWKIEGDETEGFTIKNVASGRYLQHQTTVDQQYVTGIALHKFFIKANTAAFEGQYFNILNSAADTHSLNARPIKGDSPLVVRWEAATGQNVTSSASEWAFEDVTSWYEGMANAVGDIQTGVYTLQSRLTGKFLAWTSGGLYAQSKNAGDLSQQWLLTKAADGSVRLRSLKDASYIRSNAHYQPCRLDSLNTGNVLYVRLKNAASENNTASFFNICFNSDFTGQDFLYDDSNNGSKVVRWTDGGSNTQWAFYKTTLPSESGITQESIKDTIDNARHASTITGGKSYRIVNSATGAALAANFLTGEATTDNTAEYSSELWTAEQGTGGYALKNKANGLYLQNFADGSYKLSSQPAYFAAELRDNGTWETTYSFKESDGQALCLASGTASPTKGDAAQASASWILVETNAEPDSEALDEIYLNNAFSEQTVRFRNRAYGRYISDSGTDAHTVAMKDKDESDLAQVWIVLPRGNGQYAFRNAKTGRYVNHVSAIYTAYPTSLSLSNAAFRVRLSPANASATDGEKWFNISQTEDFSGQNCWHDDTHGKLVKWSSGESTTASDWVVEKVENFTDSQVKENLNAVNGSVNTIEDGKVYRIQSNAYTSRSISENYSSHSVDGSPNAEKKAYQNWRLVKVGDKYALQNVLTNRYLQNSTGGLSSVYQTGTEQKTFTLTRQGRWEDTYTFSDNSGRGLHCSESQGYSVVDWYTSSAASVWTIKATDMTEEEIAQATADNDRYATERANENAYTTQLETFFTSTLCTELRPDYQQMTDDALRTAMGNLPEAIKAMAVKVKNNSWAKWEKEFRVSDFKGYSDTWAWQGTIGYGFAYSRLSNPTGINYTTDETMYIIVGDDIPEDATLKIETVNYETYANQGGQYTLHKGLNVLRLPQKSTLFVCYTLDTKNSGKKLADFPRINLHFEGGHVNGYYDIERHTQAQWAEMRNDENLFNDFTIQLKSRRCIFNMNSRLVQEQIGDSEITASMGMWDKWLKIDQDLMGIDEYRDRWNNLMGVHNNSDGGLYATTYGTYFGENATWIMNPTQGRSSGEAMWAQVHEMGHVNQEAINMGGCVEISNNLFANAACLSEGYTTRSNGANTAGLASHFVNKKFWFNLAGQSGYGMRLYTQLYLYFHIMGHDTTFYPRLFQKLRADGMHAEGGVYRGPNDYLKFALACCEVSGLDLSEFFEAYGFFVPVDGSFPNTYDNMFSFRTTQEEIDAAKAQMKKYPKPMGNILFIDDHITVDPNGRTDYGGSDRVGNFGDVGMYSDFHDDYRASNYSYTLNSDGLITMTGTGAVGYKLYDEEGNLLYFFNTNTATLPESVRSHDFTVKVAQADGTDVALPKPNETFYEAELYKGSATKLLRRVSESTLAAAMPELSDNGIAIVKGSNVPASILQITNVADESGNAESIVIKDKTDFYTPSALNARSLHYSRSNTAAYNSVCLPFALSLADLGEGAKIETLEGSTEVDGKEYLLFNADAQEASAGQPCIVWCPETMTEWNFSKENAIIIAAPVEAQTGNFVMKGCFTNGVIGEGKYKMNSAGTAFGITSAAGKVTAFRSYIESLSASAARSLGIMHQAQTTGVSAAPTAPSATTVYDLQGRRIATPRDRGVYIVGGKKVILRSTN